MLKYIYFPTDYELVEEMFKMDSGLFGAIAVELNRDIRGLENWRGMAFRLGVELDLSEQFEPSLSRGQQSPTKAILDWLVMSKPQFTMSNLRKVLEKIQRKDVISKIDEHLKGGLGNSILYVCVF